MFLENIYFIFLMKLRIFAFFSHFILIHLADTCLKSPYLHLDNCLLKNNHQRGKNSPRRKRTVKGGTDKIKL